jgi:pyruvate formate lyase activating enzyme
VDPIEKKPLYHILPGSRSYSIATIGCNFSCDFCQNWQISQSSKKSGKGLGGYPMPSERVVENAKRQKCKSIAYTYTEPTIYFEYAYDTAVLAKKAGLINVFVTNGFMSKSALEKIKPYLDAANVDLKSYSDDFYRKMCNGRLQPVLDSIKLMKKLGIWVEVTTLIVPEQNDSDSELNNIAEFIASVGKEIPWHISRFHPDHKYKDSYPTPIKTLRRAYNIGVENGLHYIYLGNVHEGLDTRCKSCGELLLRRAYMGVNRNYVKSGNCLKCGTKVEGLF